MIASLVALRASNIPASRSFCFSALAFSSARSKFSSAKATFCARPRSSSTNSGVNVPRSIELKIDHALRAVAIEQRQRRRRAVRRCGEPPRAMAWFVRRPGKSLLMQGCRVRNAVPVNPRPSGDRIRDREFQAAHLVGVRPVGGDDALEFGTGLGQRNRRGAELCATHRGRADQVEQLAARLRPHDRFVGRAERREHARQPLSLFVDFRLFLRAIEIVERERDILRHARHQRDDLFIRGPEFADEEHPHADALAGLDERKRDAGHDAGLASDLLPRPCPAPS